MELKAIVEKEFERFGFFQADIKDGVQWIHIGVEFKSVITIDRKYNAIRFDQFQSNGVIWERVSFGVMAPLFEVIALARHAYGISTETRAYNVDWKQSNIIPGTEGKNAK